MATVEATHRPQADPLGRPGRRRSPSAARRPPSPASCCPTPPRKNPSAAPCWPSVRAAATTTGERIPLDVAVGDQVLFAKYAGTEFKLDDADLLILAEKDILAIVG